MSIRVIREASRKKGERGKEVAERLEVGLPGDATATARSFGLGIVENTELRADELSDIVDSAAFDQSQRDAVDDQKDFAGSSVVTLLLLVGLRIRIDKVILLDVAHGVHQIHFVLVAMTPARLYHDAQAEAVVGLALGHPGEVGDGAVGEVQRWVTAILVHVGLLRFLGPLREQ